MSEPIDWEALTCRHATAHHKGLVVAIVHMPEGCWCFPDTEQALCLQHLMKAQSHGPIEIITTCLEPEPEK